MSDIEYSVIKDDVIKSFDCIATIVIVIKSILLLLLLLLLLFKVLLSLLLLLSSLLLLLLLLLKHTFAWPFYTTWSNAIPRVVVQTCSCLFSIQFKSL